MREIHERAALRLGVVSGSAVAALCGVYVVILSVGLLTLASPDQQVRQPWFTLLELLILAIAPAIVVLSVALHAWALPDHKSFAVTCAVHFAILTLSHHPAFAGKPWSPLIFSFQWPSLAYSLDILAWDVFFPLGSFFAAATVRGSGLARLVRALLIVSAVLALVGLLGVPFANMQVRNVGIIGYAVFFPTASALLAVLFQRDRRGCTA
jgi:hypothetical protein